MMFKTFKTLDLFPHYVCLFIRTHAFSFNLITLTKLIRKKKISSSLMELERTVHFVLASEIINNSNCIAFHLLSFQETL